MPEAPSTGHRRQTKKHVFLSDIPGQHQTSSGKRESCNAEHTFVDLTIVTDFFFIASIASSRTMNVSSVHLEKLLLPKIQQAQRRHGHKFG